MGWKNDSPDRKSVSQSVSQPDGQPDSQSSRSFGLIIFPPNRLLRQGESVTDETTSMLLLSSSQ